MPPNLLEPDLAVFVRNGVDGAAHRSFDAQGRKSGSMMKALRQDTIRCGDCTFKGGGTGIPPRRQRTACRFDECVRRASGQAYRPNALGFDKQVANRVAHQSGRGGGSQLPLGR